MTSALKKIPESIEVVLETVADGTFQAGTVVYGLEEGATGIAPFHGFDQIVPQQVKDAVETATEAIIAGEIRIATTRAELSQLTD